MMNEIEVPKDPKVEVIVVGKIKGEFFNETDLLQSYLVAQRKEEYQGHTLYYDPSTGVLALMKVVEE